MKTYGASSYESSTYDIKASQGIKRVGRHQALRERVMEPTPVPDNRLSPPDSFQDNESGTHPRPFLGPRQSSAGEANLAVARTRARVPRAN